MKLILYSFLLIACLAGCLTACKKDNSSALVGAWFEIATIDGLTGDSIAILHDTALILTLNKDGSYTNRHNNYPQGGSSYGYYIVTTMNKVSTNQSKPAIEFIPHATAAGAVQTEYLYALKGDTLDLTLNTYNGGGTRYVRLK